MTPYVMNTREDLVSESLAGLQATSPNLIQVHEEPAFVTRARPAHDKVALVSGGGAGHEPLHTGFVGTGMLDAAVPGRVFSSPTAHQVRTAVSHVETGEGALMVVKNYTGDVLNFSIAAEVLADRCKTETVLIDDDLATMSADGDAPGRRGTAAVIAVEKICGAAAELGAPLNEVAALGRRVNARSATLGVALQAGTLPGEHGPSFELPAGQLEFGVGIHGERGITTRPIGDAAAMVDEMATPILDHLSLTSGSNVLGIVNGLGATHQLELGVVAHELQNQLQARGLRFVRGLLGPFVTSLDMKGFSITLVEVDEQIIDLWDAPVRTPALGWCQC